MSEIPQYRWQNWNGNLEAVVDLYVPRTLDELRDAVRRAARKGRIRPVGSSRAWSPLVPVSGSLISVENFKRAQTVPGPELAIRFECGISMRELTKWTNQRGLTLISPTIYQDLSMGGAIAVGAHGTGLMSSTLSDDIIAMTIIKADGDLLRLTAADGDLFEAAKVSLGCLGILYDVTMRVWPQFNLHVEDRFLPRAEVMDGIDDMLATYEFVELYWFPFDDTMWCKMMSRTAEPSTKDSFKERFFDKLHYGLTMFSGQLILPLMAQVAPQLTPDMMKIAPWFVVTPGTDVEPANKEFHYQKAYPKIWDMSYAVPLSDSREAWERTMDLIERLGSEGKYPVNMVVHSRFIGPSHALLSPAYGRPICDIETVTVTGTPNIEQFYQEWTDVMFQIPGARPHWGKYILSPERIRDRYPEMDRFLQIRHRLDPQGVFLNDWLEKSIFQIAP